VNELRLRAGLDPLSLEGPAPSSVPQLALLVALAAVVLWLLARLQWRGTRRARARRALIRSAAAAASDLH
jgi:hypothetical protein